MYKSNNPTNLFLLVDGPFSFLHNWHIPRGIQQYIDWKTKSNERSSGWTQLMMNVYCVLCTHLLFCHPNFQLLDYHWWWPLTLCYHDYYHYPTCLAEFNDVTNANENFIFVFWYRENHANRGTIETQQWWIDGNWLCFRVNCMLYRAQVKTFSDIMLRTKCQNRRHCYECVYVLNGRVVAHTNTQYIANRLKRTQAVELDGCVRRSRSCLQPIHSVIENGNFQHMLRWRQLSISMWLLFIVK